MKYKIWSLEVSHLLYNSTVGTLISSIQYIQNLWSIIYVI